jgi:hypothetical protein
MSTGTLPAVQGNGHGPTSTISAKIDHNAVLRAVGLSLTDPNAQALLLTCDRYGLDPILKHMVLIQGRPYVTRDGLLHVAHKSGQFDGIEVLEQGETPTHHTAKVSVYRKDMGRPFTYIGRYPKNGGNKAYGPEMAVKCGEVMALRRAFNVALCAREEVWDQEIETTGYADPEPSRDHGRREVNETFARKSPPPDAVEPMPSKPSAGPMWASHAAKIAAEKRAYWHHELAIANVPEADLKRPENQMPDQHQLTNHFVTHAINSGAIRPEAVSKDGTPEGKRDPDKAKAAFADLFRRAPKRILQAVESYYAEKEAGLRVRLGMDDLVDDTTAQDAAEEASQEAEAPEGREPGSDDDR